MQGRGFGTEIGFLLPPSSTRSNVASFLLIRFLAPTPESRVKRAWCRCYGRGMNLDWTRDHV